MASQSEMDNRGSMIELDRLKYTIGRFDTYYSSLNYKCNVMLGMNSGFVLIALTLINLESYSGYSVFTKIMLLAISLCALASIFMILSVLKPYLKSDKNSLFFFGSISQMEPDKFNELSRQNDPKTLLTDIRGQVYDLACGLTRKFGILEAVVLFLKIELILTGLILIENILK